MQNSPVQTFNFRGLDYFLKRDDLLSDEFSGNKARKFVYFLDNPPLHVNKIISYGSNQSNAMYSLSVLAKLLHVKFLYVCRHLPSFLVENPIGNYANALKNGMEIYTNENPEKFSLSLCDEKSLHVKEGGAVKTSEYGIKQLANEINLWAQKKEIDIFLPSGTGTTSLYLQKNTNFRVYTCPCVGDKSYLEKQFFQLEKDKNLHPTILNPPKKYHFGKPKKELFDIWKELKESTKIEFDLLYDPVGWLTLLQNKSLFENPVLYIHQGGILGNISLIERYRYKGYM